MIDVVLPIDYEPVFPDKCPLCLKESPQDSYEIADRIPGPWYLPGFMRKKVRFPVPACYECARKLRWRTRLENWGIILIIAASLVTTMYLVNSIGLPRKHRILCLIGLGIALVPGVVYYMALEFIWPNPIALTAKADSLEFTLDNALYAAEFVQLNESAVLSIS